jgi:transcriptional regulator GlxA family with amidase domain
MRISVLVLDGLLDSGLAVTLDALSVANKLSVKMLGGTPRFDVTVVGLQNEVHSGHGLTIPVKPVTPGLKSEWVIMPSLDTTAPDELVAALDRPDVHHAKEQLLKWHAGGARIGTACVGSFLLAETGLLNSREATTKWAVAPLFRQRYPDVRLNESRVLIPSDIGVTAGSAMGHLDLALWVIHATSPGLASLVSRYMLADIRSSQATYIIPSHLAQADPLIKRFEEWTRGHLKTGFSLDKAAAALATSRRSLQRRCLDVLGKSPLAYFQDLRVEVAQSFIRGGELDLEAIAAEVGYADAATLRKFLRQRLGRGVREIRKELL